MFRKTVPQRSLFSVEMGMEPAKRARLERSWAHQYRKAALKLIDEEKLARFFDAGNGRPNKSVRLVMSVLILKEVFDLTDEEALEQLEWNTAWHYALDVAGVDAHTCQKTLHNYRVLLLKDGEGAGLFESTTAQLLAAAKLKMSRQRQDSTHIVSNIKLLTRLGLFVQTLTQFLEAFCKEHPHRSKEVAPALRDRYLDREGYFSDARSSEGRRRLEQAALDIYAVICQFEGDRPIAAMESFVLLRRLYNEQCVAPRDPDNPDQIELQDRPSSSSLQSPSDPDVTYGYKGKGYEVQLTETCSPDNPFEVVTAVNVNDANESDQDQVLPALEQVSRTCGAAPNELLADAAYGSGSNIIAAQECGTNLMAPIGAKGPNDSDGIANLGDFDFDSTNENVTACLVGRVPMAHRSGPGLVRLAIFLGRHCAGCELVDACPTKVVGGERVLAFEPKQAAIAGRRVEQATREFKERYRARSGIEATNSELKRCHGLRKLRVRRKPQVTLSVRLKVLALNIKRYVGHLAKNAAPNPAACPCLT